MVRRTHNYADGGKIVADHSDDSNTYGRALYDRARRMVGLKDSVPAPKKAKKRVETTTLKPTSRELGTGAAAKAADQIANSTRRKMEDLDL